MNTHARTRPALASVVLLFSVATAMAQAPNWKTYNYPADGFTVSFPSDPEVSASNVPVGSTSYQLRTYLVDLGQSGFMIGVCQFGSLVEGKDPNDLLQGGKKGALEESKTHLVSEKKISLGGVPGLEFDAENDTMHARARIFLAGSVLYEVIEAYPIGKPLDRAEEFLDSFRILPADRQSAPAPQ